MIFDGDINDFEFEFTFEVDLKPTSCRYLYREILPEEQCRAIERAAEYAHAGNNAEAEKLRRWANYGGLSGLEAG